MSHDEQNNNKNDRSISSQESSTIHAEIRPIFTQTLPQYELISQERGYFDNKKCIEFILFLLLFILAKKTVNVENFLEATPLDVVILFGNNGGT